MMSIPKIEGTGLTRITNFVEWVDQNIVRAQWDNQRIENKYANRTPREIIEEGNVFYMNPCLDLTLVYTALANENGVGGNMVIEVYNAPSRLDFNPIHLAMEFETEKGVVSVNHLGKEKVEIWPGAYKERVAAKRAMHPIRMPVQKINPDLPIHKSLGFKSREECTRMFEGYSLRKHLDRMKQDNTLDNYSKFLESSRGFEIREV